MRIFKIIFCPLKVRFKELAPRNVFFYGLKIILKLLVQIYVVVLQRELFLTRSLPIETYQTFSKRFLRARTILLVFPEVQKYISLRTMAIRFFEGEKYTKIPVI